jgi:hypothetical protein
MATAPFLIMLELKPSPNALHTLFRIFFLHKGNSKPNHKEAGMGIRGDGDQRSEAHPASPELRRDTPARLWRGLAQRAGRAGRAVGMKAEEKLRMARITRMGN